jgi:hypothetical protein
MKKFILAFTALLLLSCEKQTEWTMPEAPPDILVVEGFLTDEPGPHRVLLSRCGNDPAGNPEPVSGADVRISDGGSTVVLSEHPQQPGLYFTPPGFAGIPGRTYRLMISSEGKQYEATTTMRPAAYFHPLHINRNKQTGMYSISWIAPPYNAANPAMYEILLDWSLVQGYQGLPFEETHARLHYFSLPTLDVSEIFAPVMEKISFPRGTIIIEKRYSLTSDYAEFLRCLLLETSWRGGFFDMLPANLPSNISGNGNAAGYFTACGSSVISLTAGN